MVRRLVTLAVLVALVLPALRDRDSYPLSTYPMYSRTRADTLSFVVAYRVGPDGGETALDLSTVGGSDDPLIVSSLTRQAAAEGAAGTDRLCGQIADRVRTGGTTAGRIEVRREIHDTVARTAGDDSLRSAEILSACEVSPS